MPPTACPRTILRPQQWPVKVDSQRNFHRRVGFATFFLLLVIMAASGCGTENGQQRSSGSPSEVDTFGGKIGLKNDFDTQQRDDGTVNVTVRSKRPALAGGGRPAANGHPDTHPSIPTRRPLSEVESFTSDRYLIIHADDAGMCRSVNRATIDAMEKGIVSSVSIMVPCPAFDEFARYARAHPEKDFGVHLTLNAEFQSYRWGPVLPAREVPSLVDPNGHFWREERQTAAQARTSEVERELTAQIDRAVDAGISLSHLDTHMGTLLMRPDLLELYVNLGIKYDLPILMTHDRRPLRQFGMSAAVNRKHGEILQTLAAHRFPVLQNVLMHYVPDSLDRKRDHYYRAFRGLPAGVSEVLVHCGYNDRELRSKTGSARLRDGDRRIFMDSRTADEISRLGIRIINWKQFREMTDAEASVAADEK